MTAMPGLTLLAIAENHIRTNSMGLQCVVQCCYEQRTITNMTEPLFPCTNTLQTPNPPFWTTKIAVLKFPQNSGSTRAPCLDKAVHAQRGGGSNMVPTPTVAWTKPQLIQGRGGYIQRDAVSTTHHSSLHALSNGLSHEGRGIVHAANKGETLPLADIGHKTWMVTGLWYDKIG